MHACLLDLLNTVCGTSFVIGCIWSLYTVSLVTQHLQMNTAFGQKGIWSVSWRVINCLHPDLCLPTAAVTCLQQQLHHNGYIPSLMLRVKLLHQYLCACVNLKVEPHDDIPQPLILESTGQTAATLSSSGFAATGRPAALRRLQFVLVDGDQEQQQGALLQQEGVGAEGRVAANHQGGLFQLSRPTRAAGEPPPIPGAGDATASAADGIAEGAVAATETEVDQQQQEALEQQLGGRLLSVSHLWANMPLAVALSVRRVQIATVAFESYWDVCCV